MRVLYALTVSLLLAACEAAAGSGLAEGSWVAWSFTAAPVLVLGMVWAAGFARGRGQAAGSTPANPGSLGDPWRLLCPGLTWRTDAQLRVLDCQGALDGLPGELPARWVQRPLTELITDIQDQAWPPLAHLMSARGSVISRQVRLVDEPAAGDLQLHAEPVYGARGRFEGYVGRLSLSPREPGRLEPPPPEGPAAFSYTLSHDLRAPLRVVEGFARMLKQDYGQALDRVGQDHLDRVLNAAHRMNRMIDAMLAVARLHTQPLSHEPVDLSRLASLIVDELRRQEPRREVVVELQPGLLALGDAVLLEQLLQNLIGNAWKYTQRTEQARIAVACEPAADGQPVYLVRDNGAGFDMRGADRLFGLFQRLHSSSEFPGTGVGLASVKQIVQRHGGRVWAESSPGQGAVFRFTLGG